MTAAAARTGTSRATALEVSRKLGQSILNTIPGLLRLHVHMKVRSQITRIIKTACLYTDEAWCNAEFRDQRRAAAGATNSPDLLT